MYVFRKEGTQAEIHRKAFRYEKEVVFTSLWTYCCWSWGHGHAEAYLIDNREMEEKRDT